MNEKDTRSVRSVGYKLNIPKSTVRYIKTKYLNIRSYRKQTAPKYTEGQKVRVRERSG